MGNVLGGRPLESSDVSFALETNDIIYYLSITLNFYTWIHFKFVSKHETAWFWNKPCSWNYAGAFGLVEEVEVSFDQIANRIISWGWLAQGIVKVSQR